MKIYLDTSSLFKLYYLESDSSILEKFLIESDIETIFLSEISKIEFYSTVWKKSETENLNLTMRKKLLTFLKIH